MNQGLALLERGKIVHAGPRTEEMLQIRVGCIGLMNRSGNRELCTEHRTWERGRLPIGRRFPTCPTQNRGAVVVKQGLALLERGKIVHAGQRTASVMRRLGEGRPTYEQDRLS